MPSCGNSSGGGSGGSSFGGSPSSSRTPPGASSFGFSNSPTFKPSNTPFPTSTGSPSSGNSNNNGNSGGNGYTPYMGAGVRAWGDLRALAALPVLGFAAGKLCFLPRTSYTLTSVISDRSLRGLLCASAIVHSFLGLPIKLSFVTRVLCIMIVVPNKIYHLAIP